MEPPLLLNPESLSVLTYNLLYPQRHGQHADPRSNSVGYRYDRHTKSIVENSESRIGIAIGNILRNPTDLICLQEVTPNYYKRLKAKLSPSYEALYVQHHATAVHGVAIFYLFTKFIPMHYISEQHQGHTPRTHIVFDFKLVRSQKFIRVACCHLLDPRGMPPEGKTAQISEILERMKPHYTPYAISACVIAGDFNQDQWGDAPKVGKIENKPLEPHVNHATIFQPLLKTGYLTDRDYSPSEYKRKRPENKKRDPNDPQLYANKVVPRKRRIDYIWVRTLSPESIKPLPLRDINFSASDHAPVGSTFSL
jgi:endonuclease/exonuclease/phosphatase family metal-dependent hydrolase